MALAHAWNCLKGPEEPSAGTQATRVVADQNNVGDGGTELTSEGRYDFDSGFAKLMLPLIMWQAQKKQEIDLEHWRKLVEAQ